MPPKPSCGPKTSLGLRLLAGMLVSLFVGGAQAQTSVPRSIVFYYGEAPPAEQLKKFEVAVVEPDTGFMPIDFTETDTRWFSYVSVGEVSRSRSYYSRIPSSWIVGRNHEWQSEVIDQSSPGWPAFFVENVIAPLWHIGYTGFFLDTLDSYRLIAVKEPDVKRQQEGLVAVIKAIRERFPEAALIMNRGFELLPQVHDQVYAVAFESLFKSWSEARRQYVDVPETDRQWLLDQVRGVREKYSLPVIAIDYCMPSNSRCSRETAKKIRSLGLIPYVGDGRLQEINYAALE